MAQVIERLQQEYMTLDEDDIELFEYVS